MIPEDEVSAVLESLRTRLHEVGREQRLRAFSLPPHDSRSTYATGQAVAFGHAVDLLNKAMREIWPENDDEA